MQRDRNTPGPEGPATRRIVAWTLILALVLGFPLSYLIGIAQLPGGGGTQMLAVLALVALLVGGVAFLLHRRTRR